MRSSIPDRTASNWKSPLEVRVLLPLVGLQSGLDLFAFGDLLFIELLLNLIRGAHRENAEPEWCFYWLPAKRLNWRVFCLSRHAFPPREVSRLKRLSEVFDSFLWLNAVFESNFAGVQLSEAEKTSTSPISTARGGWDLPDYLFYFAVIRRRLASQPNPARARVVRAQVPGSGTTLVWTSQMPVASAPY